MKEYYRKPKSMGSNLIESINTGRRQHTEQIGREEAVECRLNLAA
jgi:hypothetical protein